MFGLCCLCALTRSARSFEFKSIQFGGDITGGMSGKTGEGAQLNFHVMMEMNERESESG